MEQRESRTTETCRVCATFACARRSRDVVTVQTVLKPSARLANVAAERHYAAAPRTRFNRSSWCEPSALSAGGKMQPPRVIIHA